MNLIHYSKEPLVSVHSETQTEGRPRGIGKPHGLWVSDEDSFGWKEWCNSEEFGLDRFTYANQITLISDAKILYLNTPEELDEFTEKYAYLDPLIGHISDRFTLINWVEVASKYQGIIITPYQWSRRMTDHTWWYYGWDCASGCIWDESVIESIKVIHEPTKVDSERT